MAFTRLTREIPITAAGGTFTIDVDSPEVEYTITGIAVMAGNVTISPTSSGAIPNNTKVIINYLATLDTTVTTFSVFGVFLNSSQTLRDQHIICDYVNLAWTVQIISNFANPDIINTSNIVNGAVTNSKLATDSVSTIKILDLAVTTNKIDNLAVTAGKIATDAVITSKILDLNVTTAKIAADAVTTAKILDLNVTTAKINDLAVTDAKLATDSVITSKILDLNVTTAKIDNLAVTTAKLDTNAVTTAKILDLNVTTSKLNTDAVTTAKILDLNVTTTKIDNLAVTDAKLAANSVITSKILDSNVTDAKLAAMPASTLKYGNALGNPGNLALGLNDIPIGNGATVTVINKSTILNGVGTYTQISCEMSFETDEINAYKYIYLPYPCLFIQAYVSVTTDIEATDNAFYEINNTFGGFSILSSSILAGTLKPTNSTVPIPALHANYTPISGLNSTIYVYTTKVTPGGRAFITLLLQKT
jgi:hypothetical protein